MVATAVAGTHPTGMHTCVTYSSWWSDTCYWLWRKCFSSERLLSIITNVWESLAVKQKETEPKCWLQVVLGIHAFMIFSAKRLLHLNDEMIVVSGAHV